MKETFQFDEGEFLIIQSPLPDNIDQYAGQWVLIRNGEVILDQHGNPISREEAGPEDSHYFVPLPGQRFFVMSEAVGDTTALNDAELTSPNPPDLSKT